MNKNKTELENLLNVRSALLNATRSFFNQNFGLEVTTPVVVDITGSCENIDTLFKLPFFGKTKYLSQTGQLHLEYLVKTMNKKCWTIARSFRAEPEVDDRHLREFSLIEFEGIGLKLKDIMSVQEQFIIYVIKSLLATCHDSLKALGADIEYLKGIKQPFRCITYSEAIEILNNKLGFSLNYGDNLSSSEETALLGYFKNQPVFVTTFPTSIKFFNMKRLESGKDVYSVDLLLPPLGEASGGAEREENLEYIKRNLTESSMYKHLSNVGAKIEDFDWYFDLFKNNSCSTGGAGVGFERLISFLLKRQEIGKCM